MRCDFLKSPLDVATVGFKPTQNFVDQRSIFDHEQMRVEDGRVLGPDRFSDFLLHLQDLHPGLNQRRLEAGNLVSDLRRLDVMTPDVIEIVAYDMNDAVADPGRDANAAKPDFLVTAAHPRAILSRNQSSWKRALINSSSSASALAASGPSQRMWSFDP